jgi:molecular chaperone GrpE
MANSSKKNKKEETDESLVGDESLKQEEKADSEDSEQGCGENCECESGEKKEHEWNCEGAHSASSVREEELKNQVKRALADYQNLEKRTQEQRGQWIRTANKELILKLLPVLDILSLAYKHLQDEGLRLSIQKFNEVLSHEGVTEFISLGQPFVPESMEAVGTKEGEKGRVVEQVKAGYKLNGEILRPAQVIIGEGEKK